MRCWRRWWRGLLRGGWGSSKGLILWAVERVNNGKMQTFIPASRWQKVTHEMGIGMCLI